jgi:hypothetical protein
VGASAGARIWEARGPRHLYTAWETVAFADSSVAAGMLNGDVLPPGLTRMSGRHLEGLPCK